MITTHESDGSVAVASFYLRFDKPRRRTTSAVQRTILYQLLRRLSKEDLHSFVHEFGSVYSGNTVTDDIEAKKSGRGFIVIDALDECDDLPNLLDLLSRLRRHFRILVFSRDLQEIRLALSGCVEVSLDAYDRHTEIMRFVRTRVSEYHQSGKLVVGTEGLLDEIVDALTQQADGMYVLCSLS